MRRHKNKNKKGEIVYRSEAFGEIIKNENPEVIKAFWDGKGYSALRAQEPVLAEAYFQQAENWHPNKIKGHTVYEEH